MPLLECPVEPFKLESKRVLLRSPWLSQSFRTAACCDGTVFEGLGWALEFRIVFHYWAVGYHTLILFSLKARLVYLSIELPVRLSAQQPTHGAFQPSSRPPLHPTYIKGCTAFLLYASGLIFSVALGYGLGFRASWLRVC